jgi:transcriptional regulator with XRE-family HTH domain
VATQAVEPMTSPSSWQHELGVAIRRARRAARLSQDEIAVAVGVRQSSVSQWERGITTPTTHHLLLLLKLLGAALVNLLLTDERTPGLGGEAR